MPRLSAERRRDRETSLVAAARSVFAAQGYDTTSIADIARRANVSDGLLYRYFEDKRGLLTAVLEQFFDDLIDRARAAVGAARGFEARLGALIEAHLATMVDEPDLCRLFLLEMRNANTYRGSPLHRSTQRYTAIVVEIATEARADGEMAVDADTRMFRDLVFGGMEHIGWHFLSGGSRHDPATAAARLAHMLVRGARSPLDDAR